MNIPNLDAGHIRNLHPFPKKFAHKSTALADYKPGIAISPLILRLIFAIIAV